MDVVLYEQIAVRGLRVEGQESEKILDSPYALVGYELEFFPFRFQLQEVVMDSAYVHLQKYEGVEKMNIQFLVDYFSNPDKPKKDISINIPSIKVANTYFQYDDYNKAPRDTGVDFSHIELKNLFLSVSGASIINDSISADINQVAFVEKSGFELLDFSASSSVSPSGIILKNLNILTPSSDIKTDLTFETESFKDYRDFVHKVKFHSDFRKSTVEMGDVAYFARNLTGIEQKIDLTGIVKGRVDNLSGKNLEMDMGRQTRFSGNIELKGLPDFQETFIYLSVKDLQTSANDLEQFPLPPFNENKNLELPPELGRLGNVSFRGKFSGFYTDFVTYGEFKTALGRIKTDVSVKQGDELKYNGKVKAYAFGFGEMFKVKDLGKLTANLKIKGEGITKETAKVNLDGVVSSLNVKGYNYKSVEVEGDLQNEKFNGYLSVKDKNIDFDFEGLIDYSEELPMFSFTADIRKAKLRELQLTDKPDSSANISAKIKMSLKGNNLDNIEGELYATKVQYSAEGDTNIVDTLEFIADKYQNRKRIQLNSDIMNAEIRGDYTLADLPSSFKNLAVNFIPSYDYQGEKGDNQDIKFSVEVKDAGLIERLWLMETEISPFTFISGNYNSERGELNFNASTTKFKYKDYKFESVYVKAKTINDKFYLNIGSNLLYLTDSSAIENFNVNTELRKDTIVSNINWENYTDLQYKGDINLKTVIKDFKRFDVELNDSYLVVSDTLWEFNNDNEIIIDTSSVMVRNLSLKTSEQSILVDGKVSQKNGDQIDAVIKNFKLGNVNPFLPSSVITINGEVDGTASLSDIHENIVFTSDLKFKDFKLNNSFIGDGIAQSNWDREKKQLTINGEYYRGSVPTIKFNGNYFPEKEENSLSIDLELNRTGLKIARNYVDEYVSDLNGAASGKAHISGTPDEPLIKGKFTLQKLSFKVNYLNTNYTASGNVDVVIEPDMFAMNNATLLASREGKRVGGKADVTGTVFHENYKNMNIDLGVAAENFLCLNTSSTHNEKYYGTAFATGSVNISGYADQLVMDISMKTEKNTQFNIPLEGAEEVSQYDFISFKGDGKDSLIENYEVDLTGVRMNFDLQATPDAEVRLIFDEKVGDVMKGRGSGNLEMEITNTGNFNIYGKYTLTEGDYLFTLENVINKKFVVQNGGTIAWNGAPYEAELDLTAVYRLRTSLINIMRGTTIDSLKLQEYKRRVPVELNLHMTEELSNPEIRFDVELPLADEDTKQKLESQLYLSQNQVNQQEMNRQVFALLMLNTFLPPQNTRGPSVGNQYAGIGRTSTSEMLSNQLSNWLSSISNDFDIGVNYRPGGDVTSDEVELALSTEVFNDRMVLESSVGYSGQDSPTQRQNTTTIVGDFKAEYKVSEDGKFRVQAFNRSNNYSLLENKSLYTQGLGLSYQENFNTWKGFFRKLFGKKKKDKEKEEGKEDKEQNDEEEEEKEKEKEGNSR